MSSSRPKSTRSIQSVLSRWHGHGPEAVDVHDRVDPFETRDRRLEVPVPKGHVDGAGDPFALPCGAPLGVERPRGGVDPLRQGGQQMRWLKPPGLEAHGLELQRGVSGGGREVVASLRAEREAALGGARPQVEADRGSRRLELRVDRQAGNRERLRVRGGELEGLELGLQVAPALAVVERGGDLQRPDGSRGRDADVFERGLLERQHGKASARPARRHRAAGRVPRRPAGASPSAASSEPKDTPVSPSAIRSFTPAIRSESRRRSRRPAASR